MNKGFMTGLHLFIWSDVMLVSDKVRPPTRYDRLRDEKIRTKEVRERDKERGGWIQPFFVPHLPFYFILSCFQLVYF